MSFIGLGYVGLCIATVYAAKGFKVIGVDVDPDKIDHLTNGKPPIHEPRLGELLKEAIVGKRIRFTTDMSAIEQTNITFLTVGTLLSEDKSVDLNDLKKVTEKVGATLRGKNGYHLVVVKSTVIPGTTAGLVRKILERSSGKVIGNNIGLCVNPEFLAEGSAIQKVFRPHKIVIGGIDDKSTTTLTRFFEEVYHDVKVPFIVTNPTTAEIIKYANNAFLATRISTINTIANICQRLDGVDVETVANAVGLDPRIGPLYLKAGPGYGGSCLRKDLQTLILFSRDIGYDPILFESVEKTNHQQTLQIVELVQQLVGNVKNRIIAVLGLAFKKDTDDVREAASIRVINELVKEGARVKAYDPMALENARKILPESVELMSNAILCLKNADCAILMTEWDEFRRLHVKDFNTNMKTSNVVDARRILDPSKVEGLNYMAIGLGKTKNST